MAMLLGKRKSMYNILLAFLLTLTACHSSENENAVVLSKTPEMSKMGEEILTKNHWKQTEASKATRVIVVIRTAENNPLAAIYASFDDLDTAADAKQDKTSNSYVIYTFAQDEKRKLTVIDKVVISDPLLNH
jgi:hypothetical protein